MLGQIASLAVVAVAAVDHAADRGRTESCGEVAFLSSSSPDRDAALDQLAWSAWLDSTDTQREEIHRLLKRHHARVRPLAEHLEIWADQLSRQVTASATDSPLAPLIAHLRRRIARLHVETAHGIRAILQGNQLRRMKLASLDPSGAGVPMLERSGK